jgi:serine/threonine-protein kinase SRPK3
MPEHEVLRRFGTITQENLRPVSGSIGNGPKYVVKSADMHILDSAFLDGNIVLINLGNAFKVGEPIVKPNIEACYTAPESLFQNEDAGKEVDIWSLACTIFEMRAGYTLFGGWACPIADVFSRIVKTLGKLPDPLHTWWLDTYKPDLDEVVPGSIPLRQLISEIAIEDYPERRVNSRFLEKPGVKISTEEATLFEDLLNKMLALDPKARISIGAVLEHPWFRYQDNNEGRAIEGQGSSSKGKAPAR